MATINALAYNIVEKVGLVRPRIEVVVHELSEHPTPPKPLRMQWVPTKDAHGRRVMRVEWVEDTSEDRKQAAS